ncbi:MAG: Gfo/Idh/MocA family oxidoreductase [Anaerolineae bacterium]|nr:Gfo/Idh/MocA family oxidoreductase [Anaerolineae bacterium]
MTPLRIVLAGLGVRGRHWAQVITRSPRCEIVAYADPNPAARERAIAEYGDHPAFGSAEQALAAIPDAQALVLANPPIGRESQIRATVERGIPMLIEKPLALDLNEAAHLVSIAESAQVPLMVGLNFRYLHVTRETMRLLNDGTVGKAAFGRFTYERYRDGRRPDLNKYPLTMDQPMLWEQSIHHFDLMRYVYQSEPVSVMCQTWNPSWSMYASDANVAALFTFANGMIVNYQGTWQSGWSEPGFEWRTDCTNGIISQRHQFGDLYYAQQADPKLTAVDLPPHEQWITETTGLLNAFLDSVIDGKPLECSGRDHLTSLAMVQACIVSSRDNRSVAIASVLPQVAH